MMPAVARRPVAERLRRWLIARCAPISIDGQTVEAITIDGEDVSEVTMDGDVVFEDAIPDSEDLQARYDATELSLNDGDSVSTWADGTGNGYDLTAGDAPTFKTGIINGNAIVRFDGATNNLTVSWNAVSAPHYIFVAFQKPSGATGNNQDLFDGDTQAEHNFRATGGDTWYLESDQSDIRGGTVDADVHILGAVVNGSNSAIRIDGSSVASGTTGTASSNGLTVGERGDGSLEGEYDVGEILFYNSQPTISNVESYLADKWGVTI